MAGDNNIQDKGKSGFKIGKLTSEDRVFLTLFLVVSLGGAIRKWFTTSGGLSNVVLLIQMILPFFWMWTKSRFARNPFKVYGNILYPFFFYLVYQIINPLQHSYFHGIIGIIIYGGFWIGIFYYLSNREFFHPQRYGIIIFIICALEVVLAFIQYQLPPGHILNTYANVEAVGGVAQVGDKVRVTGTFSYLSGYTAFLLFYAYFIWALIRLRVNSWIYSVAAGFGIAAAFMSGSRSAVLFYLAFLILILIKEFPISRIPKVIGQLLLPSILVFMLSLLNKGSNIGVQVEKAYDNFIGRVEANRKSGEEQTRIIGDFAYFDFGRLSSPVTGIGTAATYQGAKQLFGTSRATQEFGYVESEFHKVLLEGGWLLFILKVLLATVLAFNLSFKGPLRWLTWLFLVYATPIVFNPHNSTFLLLGIMLVDNVIWRQKQQYFLQKRQRDQEEKEMIVTEKMILSENN